MLLVEKWVSLALYNPTFYAISAADAPAPYLDAWYRAFAGAGLLAVCLLVSRFSPPASRRTWKRSRPSLWPAAAAFTVAVVAGVYLVLWLAGALRGNGLSLWWPTPDLLWLWIFGGQAVRAFAEEVYYRGLLLSEMQRLAPRLGLRSEAARRWVPLLVTSMLFGMEHLYLGPPEEMLRRLVFTVSLGLLLGMIVLASSNIHLAAGIHAWINWLLLGAAPHLVGGSGEPALAPGAYVGTGLALAFGILFGLAAWRARRDRINRKGS
jgi:membrane protease YdiL (CAAX protease family)